MRIASTDLDVEIWPLGACVNDIRLFGAPVLLGLADERARRASTAYLGEIVGPYGNRIEGARFAVDGVEHRLDANFNGRHTLHGGSAGVHRQEWDVVERTDNAVTLALSWSDAAGEYPGPIHAKVRYAVNGSSLTLKTEASADVPTYVNVVSHPYFRLGGTTVDDHVLTVHADAYVPVDADAIPLPDAPAAVSGDLDLRHGRLLADTYVSEDEQIMQFGGLDHCFVPNGSGLRSVARLDHPASGRWLEIDSDEVGLQVYAGMMLDDTTVGPDGPYGPRQGLALETQGLPNGPNRPDFPSTLVRPGEVRTSTTVWRFGQG